MAHHQPQEELKPFRLSDKNKKSFGILALVGVVLLVAGFLLSNVNLPANSHGEGHGDAHDETEHMEEHKEGGHGEDHHSNAGELMKFASASHEIGGEGGHGHADETHGHDDGHGDPFAETFHRAHWDESQNMMPHHEKHVTAASKFGGSLLMGTWFWLVIALFGAFFISVGYVANAGWYVVIKRILENYYRFLPIAGLLLLIIYFAFGDYLWEWKLLEKGDDWLIDHKRGFLNVVFVFGTAALMVGIWSMFAHMLKQFSHKEEAEGGVLYHKKSIRWSAGFLPLFAFGFAMTSFLWLMSLEPHWFSTIYGVYCFAGLFVGGMTVTMFIANHLNDGGFLPSLTDDHRHDMGKFIFAFSVFWAYIWVSQYLLIWYANIPEETVYYWNRFQDYKLLFAVNVIINFVFPFIALMTRDAKRKKDSLRSVGRVLLFGRFLDIYLLVAPGVLGGEGGFGTLVMGAGAVCLIGTIFLFVVFKGFEDAPLEARKHPYFPESIRHNTGV